MRRKTEVIFDGDGLVESVQAYADHVTGGKKLTLKTHTILSRVSGVSPTQIKGIRKRLNMSQAVFAAVMNVSKVTAISWEKGRRKPTGPALRLLDIVRKNPALVE